MQARRDRSNDLIRNSHMNSVEVSSRVYFDQERRRSGAIP